MKRTSGNGTAMPQFVYVLISIPIPLLCKIGISNNVGRRSGEVSKKVFGWAVPIFFVFIPWGWHLEQAMHRFFRFANVRYGGSKEWFVSLIAPLAILILALVQLFWLLLVLAVALWVSWILAGCPANVPESIGGFF